MGFWDTLFGGYQKVGSPEDVTLINRQGYENYLNKLYGAMGNWSTGMGGNLTQAQNMFTNVAGTADAYNNFLKGVYGLGDQLQSQGQNLMSGFGEMSGQAGKNLASLEGAAGNATNYSRQMMNMYQNMSDKTGGFDPNSAVNAYLGMNPQLAQLANQNVSGALSDVYQTGRSQAQAAADEARRQTANQLAASGLLRSGSAVNAMTQATARPQMEMETQLAGLRSQALQNQLGQLQGQAGSLIGQGYSQAGQLGMNAAQLGLAGQELAGNLTGQAASGYQNLANMYGNYGLGSQNLAQNYQQLGLQGLQGATSAYATAGQGLAGIGGLYSSLLGQGYGLGAELNQPYYYTPQYARTQGIIPGLFQGATQGLTALGTASMGIPQLGTVIGRLLG